MIHQSNTVEANFSFTRYADIDDFCTLNSSELPEGVEWGASYTTYCVNPPVYTAHLLRKFVLSGGKIMRRRLHKLEEAFSIARNVSIVVNCSGTGFNDPACFITRGESWVRQSDVYEADYR